MTVGDWVTLGWGVCGIIAGLAAANWVYADHRGSTEDPGIDAVCAFGATLLLLPVILAGVAVYALIRVGGWLLPAYRAERRERRVEVRRTEAEIARLEIDKLHAQVGLPAVDWEARQP